jgi:signal transduction histidine kinase
MTSPVPNRVTRNTALVLYGVLLVLPTIVLGALHWHQLLVDHRAQIAAVPINVDDAKRRLQDALEKRVSDLIDREEQRPFYHYKQSFFSQSASGTPLSFSLSPSPLATGPRPSGILAWFSYSYDGRIPLEIFSGGRDDSDEWRSTKPALLESLHELARRESADTYARRMLRAGKPSERPVPLPLLAMNLSTEDNIDCLHDELPSLAALRNEHVGVQVYEFHLRLYFEADGTARALASRIVVIPNRQLRGMPSCFSALGRSTAIVQGFFIDTDWLFNQLPQLLAMQVLDNTQQYFSPNTAGPALGSGYQTAAIRPVRALHFETDEPRQEEYGTMRVAVDTRDLESRFRSQSLHFLGVGAMLVLSLVTGLVLLLRSVQRDLESARRTENFVAAVTHELRTPLSAIRLYGEMLQEGWVSDDQKRADYYKRIVRETGRLETLVERVLEKSQVTSNEAAPEAGDLNRVVESLGTSLLGLGTAVAAEDVVFELAPDLPQVMLTLEGVRSIVTNLVENARKYAPVKLGTPGAEPIVVVTRILHDKVVLEVKDRGPGIPPGERTKIFEAFYRVGNEATRTARGTGLGLHLVALQSQAMGARVQVLDRKGGGTIFRVTFRSAGDAATSEAVIASPST